MILYSSELKSKPRCSVTTEYRMPIESAAEIRCRDSRRPSRATIDGGAVRLAHAVDHDHEAFIPAGGEVRRCGMGQVMVDVPDPVEPQVGQGSCTCDANASRESTSDTELTRDRVELIHGVVRGVVEGMDDLVDLATSRPAQSRQARIDPIGNSPVCLRRLIRSSATPTRTPVDDQRGGGIVPLRDPILAFFEHRPVPAFEVDCAIDAADPDDVHRA